MAQQTFQVGTLIDDAGTVLTAPVVTITSVLDKSGTPIASHGATVNGSGTATPISVDYDPVTKGEAWIILAVSQAGHTITGLNALAGGAFFCAKDSGLISADLDAAISTRLASSGYTAPDNADIVTALADAASLLSRTDPTTALTAVKAVTDHLNTALELNGSVYRFTTASLVNAPTGGSAPNDAAIQADVQAVLNAVPSGSASAGSVEAVLATLASNQAAMTTSLTSILNGVTGMPAALLATTIDGTLTLKQILDIQESIATGKYVNSPSVSNGPQVTTYYRADGTTVLATDTVTFNSSGQATGRTVAFTSP